jgi:hypothetical protein
MKGVSVGAILYITSVRSSLLPIAAVMLVAGPTPKVLAFVAILFTP